MKFPYKLIDLTHTISPDIPTWDGQSGFEMTQVCDYAECTTTTQFRVQYFSCKAGLGTHIDAPAHCFPSSPTVADLSLQNLVTNCVVLDVSAQAGEQYRLSVADIEKFEHIHGILAPNTFVFIRTGWDRYWPHQNYYCNNYLFPSVSIAAATLLLHRNIAGLGIDTLSPDRPEDDFTVHALLLKAGKYLVENVTNLQHVPPVGAFSMALPPKIKGGTEAPVRLIALIP